MAQLQHNMWVIAARTSVLSIITGGGEWVEIKIHANPLCQHLLLTAEKKFWRCILRGGPCSVQSGDTPLALKAVKIVDNDLKSMVRTGDNLPSNASGLWRT